MKNENLKKMLFHGFCMLFAALISFNSNGFLREVTVCITVFCIYGFYHYFLKY